MKKFFVNVLFMSCMIMHSSYGPPNQTESVLGEERPFFLAVKRGVKRKADKELKHRVLTRAWGMQYLAASPGGRMIAGADNSVARVWDTHDDTCKKALDGALPAALVDIVSDYAVEELFVTPLHEQEVVTAIALSAESRQLAVAYECWKQRKWMMRLFDVYQKKETFEVPIADIGRSIIFSPKDRYITLETGYSSKYTLIDMNYMENKPQLLKDLSSFSFSPDERYSVMSKLMQDEVMLHDLQRVDESPVRLRCCSSKTVFSGNGRDLVAQSGKGVRIWNRDTLHEEPRDYEVDGYGGSASASLSCDGRLLTITGFKLGLKVYDIDKHTLVNLDKEYLPRVVFSPSADYMLALPEDGVKVIDISNPGNSSQILEEEGRMRQAVFVGNQLATLSREGVKVWDWETIKRVCKARQGLDGDEAKVD